MGKSKLLRDYLNQFVPKDSVDICCLVAIGDGEDLANTTIRSCETKDFKQIIEDLKDSVDKLRKRKNESHNKKMSIVKFLPTLYIEIL